MAANAEYLECLSTDDTSLERVRFFQRQLLSASDMTAEQDYFREKLRRHNRFLHGWGVVCGLVVEAAPIREFPWRVSISEGYALGPYGDDIYVPDTVYFDLGKCGPGGGTDPCEPSVIRPGTSNAQGTVYIAIKYAECVTRPVRAMPEDCGCDTENCQYSRIRDSFELVCLDQLPPSHRPRPGPSLCELIRGGGHFPCPPCAEDPYVILARISLPGPATQLKEGDIMNDVRRRVFSTAVLQDQLIKCCCDERVEREETLRVTGVSFLAQDGTIEGQLTRNLSVDLDPPGWLTPNRVKKISITLNRPINVDSVDDRSFRIEPGTVSGTLSVGDSPAELVFELEEPLPRGEYKATLFGTAGDERSPVRDQDGNRLDGAPSKLPSGDGSAGDDFVFEFTVDVLI